MEIGRKLSLPRVGVTRFKYFKHVMYLRPISAFDTKQVRGYEWCIVDNMGQLYCRICEIGLLH